MRDLSSTAERIDEFLELALCCHNQSQFDFVCVMFARKYDRKTKLRGIHEGEQLLRRLSYKRFRGYKGPANCSSRSLRIGFRWTWMELKVLEWAFYKIYSDQSEQVTPQYIAVLLQRTEKEVEEQRNVKHGIKGFAL